MQTPKIIRIAAITALVILVPFFGNIFVDGWNWTLFDFAWAGALIFGTGLVYELAVKKIRTPTYRTIAAFALALAFLLIWIDGAVGIF